MKTEVRVITPEIAREWLLFNRRNRPVKEGQITRYARNMTTGDWRLTGEAIKFDSNGDLLDGQNRLYACIKADCAFTTLVVWDLEPDAQDAMDTQSPRSASDALHLHNFTQTNVLAASVRVRWAYERGFLRHCMSQIPPREAPTNTEIVQYASDHPDIVDAAQFAAGYRKSLPVSAGSIATAYLEFLAIDVDDTAEFFNRISELKTKGVGDPIHTLIKRTQEIQTTRGVWLKPATALYMILRTWNACRSGESLVKLQFGSDIRGWALMPEPK